jgi:hypothetical protein
VYVCVCVSMCVCMCVCVPLFLHRTPQIIPTSPSPSPSPPPHDRRLSPPPPLGRCVAGRAAGQGPACVGSGDGSSRVKSRYIASAHRLSTSPQHIASAHRLSTSPQHIASAHRLSTSPQHIASMSSRLLLFLSVLWLLSHSGCGDPDIITHFCCNYIPDTRRRGRLNQCFCVRAKIHLHLLTTES